MGAQVLAVTLAGLVASVILVVLSVRAGRQQPPHRVLWSIAVTALSASILFRVVLAVVVLVNGSVMDALPIMVGNLAVVGALAAAFWRPAWTGWMLIATGVALPALDWLLEATVVSGSVDASTVPAMLGFYGVPAVVTGVLLVLSARGADADRSLSVQT